MTREQKIKYLSLVASGEIIPAKPLPPGTYVPANDAKPSFYAIWDALIVHWDRYSNGGLKVNGEALFALPMDFSEHGSYCFIPADLQNEFQAFHDFNEDNFSALAMDKVIIEKLTPEQIALHQLKKYEEQLLENEADKLEASEIYSKREFEKIIRPQLFRALDVRRAKGRFSYNVISLNQTK